MPNRASTLPSQPTLLVVGDAAAPTGFARVMHSILEHLRHDYEIHHLGVNYHGEPHDYDWKIYPAKLGGDLQGVGRLASLAETVRPDLVFLFNDLWVLTDYVEALQGLGEMPPTVAYCPIDAGPVDPKALRRLGDLDRFVVYTEFARREMEKALSTMRRRGESVAFPPVDVIAHGIDAETFHPRDYQATDADDLFARQQAIEALHGRDDPSFDDAFIVLNANRNQPRKRIDITLKGFALFAEGKPAHVKLHLHMGVEDMGWNLIDLARRYGIEDRMILTTDQVGLPAVPEDQLNQIFQTAAVGVNTSIAEGWGLVSFEHAATGAAQIVPRHSACAELWEDAALFLEPVLTLTTPTILTDGHLVSAEDLADALERLYRDPRLLRQMSLAAYRRSQDPRFRWKTIAGEWHRLFRAVLAGPSPAVAPHLPAETGTERARCAVS